MCKNAEHNKSSMQSSFLQEECKNCKFVININQLTPCYTGLLATYDNDQCCTISCLVEPIANKHH